MINSSKKIFVFWKLLQKIFNFQNIKKNFKEFLVEQIAMCVKHTKKDSFATRQISSPAAATTAKRLIQKKIPKVREREFIALSLSRHQQ